VEEAPALAVGEHVRCVCCRSVHAQRVRWWRFHKRAGEYESTRHLRGHSDCDRRIAAIHNYSLADDQWTVTTLDFPEEWGQPDLRDFPLPSRVINHAGRSPNSLEAGPDSLRTSQSGLLPARLQGSCAVVVNSSRCHGANVTMRTLTKPAYKDGQIGYRRFTHECQRRP
jgi:hypothetical protein